jgi:hypothetical protein
VTDNFDVVPDNLVMVATAVTYGLLVLDVLVVVLLLELVLLAPVVIVRRLRRVPDVAGAGPLPGSADHGSAFRAGDRSGSVSAGSVSAWSAAGSVTGFGDVARNRRCDACRSGWLGRPGTDASLLVLRLRRFRRRRARSAGRPVPAWAVKQGWSRCPSCFSSRVRDSRRQHARAG